ncbi:hypothetical protein O5472_26735, partial [Escherichia coli]|nr:hypothetical protein [Escherichia coli]
NDRVTLTNLGADIARGTLTGNAQRKMTRLHCPSCSLSGVSSAASRRRAISSSRCAFSPSLSSMKLLRAWQHLDAREPQQASE